MDLNQNPETEELENLRTRLITDFTYSSVTLVIFFIAFLIIKYFFRIPLYNEICYLILGWFIYNYLNLYILKKRISLKIIKKIDFFHHIVALLFVPGIFYYTGSILWIGAIFYIFTIIYASTLLTPKESFTITFIAFALFTSVVLLEYFNLIPFKEIFQNSPYLYQDPQYVLTTVLSIGLVFLSVFITIKNFAQILKKKNVELAIAKKN